MMNFSLPSEASRKNYRFLIEILTRVSYKPGWKIVVSEDQNECAFTVIVRYEGYESKNAACLPIAHKGQTSRSERVAAKLLGKSFCEPEERYYSQKFYIHDLERMPPEALVKHVIADTIRGAEMFEFERWFKLDGNTVCG
jgi:hypothetical protein